MKRKILIVSKSNNFLSFTKDTLNFTYDDINVIHTTSQMLKVDNMYKEYLYHLIIIDVDFSSDELLNSIKVIRDYSKINNLNPYILCISSKVDAAQMRDYFKSDVDDYISIKDFSKEFLEQGVVYEKLNLNIKNQKEVDEILQNQFGFIRDNQDYDKDLIDDLMKYYLVENNLMKRFIFFRIDNITKVYKDLSIDRVQLQKTLNNTIEKNYSKLSSIIFTKRHSGLILIDEVVINDLLNIQLIMYDKLGLNLSFIIDKELIDLDNYLNIYKRILFSINDLFYRPNQSIIFTSDENNYIEKYQKLFDQAMHNLIFRYEINDLINIDYFINRSLDLIKEYKIVVIDVVYYYSKIFEKIISLKKDLSAKAKSQYREFLVALNRLDNFDNLKTLVLEMNETLKKELCITHNENKHINSIMTYVEDNLHRKITLDEISDHVDLSKVHTSRIFKQEQGIALFEYINKRKMEKAEKLLENEDMSIKDVGIAVGIDDPFYFSKTFKSVYGVSPSIYRRVRR